MSPKITAHMIVKNEDQFIWYAIQSVLPYVTQFLIYDTGSEDKTVEVIKSIKSEKIILRQTRADSATDIGRLRQKQMDETLTDWFWIVDGDEIYGQIVCEEIIQIIQKDDDRLEGIVVGRFDLIGDIYHYQSSSVGTYDLFGRKGHHVIRLINKKSIPGLHIEGTYPYEGYYDSEQKEIIHHAPAAFRFTKGKMLHAMYLPRSSKGANLLDTFHRKKWKVEKGIAFQEKFSYPEVLFRPRPANIPDVTQKRSLRYEVGATVITPLKLLKRRILH